MRYLITLCALALVLGVVGSVQAEVQDVKLSGDVQVRWISRDSLNLDSKRTAAYSYVDDDWFDETVRIQVDANLTDDVSAKVRIINERDYDAVDDGGSSVGQNVEIDLGSIMLDNMFGYPVKATIGRQEIMIGEGFLVGDGFNEAVDTAAAGDYDLAYGKSVRRAFDAFRLTYTPEDYPVVVDLLTAKVDEDFGTGGEVDLDGININYNHEDMAIFDLGYFVKRDTTNDATEATVKALSLRVESTVAAVEGLTAKAEYVTESGNVGMANTRGTDDVDASAWYIGGEYVMEDSEYQPYFSATYMFASGDKDTGSPANDDGQFDPLFEDGELGIIAELLPNGIGGEIQTNYEGWKLGAGLKPTETLSVDVVYSMFDRDETAAGISDDLFDELDIILTYDYTEDVQFGLSAAWFEPGKFYKDTYTSGAYNYDDTATQIVGSVKVSF